MPKNIKTTSACVARPNTPESDLLPMIDHIVHGIYAETQKAWSVIVSAEEPLTAMDRVKEMSEDEFEALPKVDEDGRLLKRKNAAAIQNILVSVHPGSACGSADFNIGCMAASESRAKLVRELDAWVGPVVVIDGGLSNELKDYPALDNALDQALARAKATGLMSLRMVGDDPEQNDRIREVIEGMVPAQKRDAVFSVTGAWYDSADGGGCVGGVHTVLLAMGCNSSVSESAVQYDFKEELDVVFKPKNLNL